MAVMPVLITFYPYADGKREETAASQSSTLVIRGLAVGEIEFRDIFRVIFKEIRIALIVGVLLSVVNGIRIYIMYDRNIMLGRGSGDHDDRCGGDGKMHRMCPSADSEETGA